MMPQRLALALLAAIALAPQARAQEATAADGRLRVFLDCNRCDFDYLRTELAYVDYVRDRADARLHILVTTQGTGAGGTAYTMSFIGLKDFAGKADTLVYTSRPTDTRDEIRRGIALST
jgi:hypothetical protein